MRLWLDDIRPAPYGWEWAKSVNTAIALVTYRKQPFEEASLDHDLGEFAIYGGNGVKLTDWMAENNVWPTEKISVHSANPVGVKTMLATIDRYGHFTGGYGILRTR